MNKKQEIQLIIADDHQIFRDGIISLLNFDKDIRLLGVASDGAMLLQLLENHTPDVVLLDISMPGIGGIELIPIIKNAKPNIRILILSMHTQDEYVYSVIQAGADGFLAKQNTSRDELFKAIRAVYSGQEYYSSSVINIIKTNYLKALTPSKIENKLQLNVLTKREQEILKLVVEGYTNAEIAEQECITIRTVETHKTNILQKLDLRNSVELVKYAIKNKLLDMDSIN
jgi:DNA-binding NarL/FixJ family response regulator